MAQILDMPRLSDTMKEGVLRKWHKQEGDKLAPGEVIAEVETDKATMDFEAFDEAVLLKRLIGDGDAVPVGAPVAIVGKAGEDIGEILEQARNRAAAGAEGARPAKSVSPAAAAPGEASRPESSAARRATPAHGTAASRAAPPARAAPPERAPAAPPAGDGAKILASPLARRLAGDLGIDLRGVKGSGPGGRIVERDVKAAGEGGGTGAAPDALPPAAPRPASPAPPPHASSSSSSASRAAGGEPARPADGSARLPERLIPERRAEPRSVPPPQPTGDDVVRPLSLMRRTIARRLVESKSSIPHFYLTADAAMDDAMSFRQQVSEVHGAKLSVNDLVLKAAALALRQVPEANATFTDEAIVQLARVDVGIAVAIDDGLVTPVIRDADRKTLGQIANEARELAARARDRKLRPEEMTGSTFTVSNLGMFGVKEFSAIINPPEAAILAVGAVRQEPVVKDGAIGIGQRMSLTLSCDHRVVDGATGARLLQALVTILERPISLAF